MLRLVVTGLWVCAVTVGASYGVALWTARGYERPTQQEFLEGLEYEKTKVINVPMIAEGAVQGYIVAQFVFTVDARTHRQLTVPPETFVVDEAFRHIYGDEEIDFANLARVDLKELTSAIRTRVNERLGAEIVQEVLVEDFNYVAKSDLRR
jgi:hypothetical protein